MANEIERVTEPEYLVDLADQSIEELRRKRQECQDIENGLSYVRRVLHGRLDIVRSELEQRSSGSPSSGLQDIIDRLPALLAEGSRSGGLPRPPQDLQQGELAERLVDELDAAFPPARLAQLPSLDDSEVQALATGLSDHEHQISAGRQQLHGVIDTVHGEIIRRYQSGSVDVDALLS